MKTKSILIAFLSFVLSKPLVVHAQASYADTVKNTSGLLGYWRFSASSQANSEVGGYTGIFHGGASVGPANSGPAFESDPTNTAAVFNGTNGYVTTNLLGQIATGGSIIGWFNLTPQAPIPPFFYIAGESQIGNDFDIQIDPASKQLRFYTDSAGYVASPAAIQLNTWHFFACTFTANTSRSIYIDGSLVASNVPSGHGLNSSPFTIGDSGVFSGRYFNGKLDEIAVFNRELTSTEISNIYASANLIYAAWIAGFSTGGLSRFDQDANGDGITNGLAFLLGGDPIVAGSTTLPVLTKTQNGFTYRFTRAARARGNTTITAKLSNDLAAWPAERDIAIPGPGVTISDQGDHDAISVTIPNTDPRTFVRLGVTAP